MILALVGVGMGAASLALANNSIFSVAKAANDLNAINDGPETSSGSGGGGGGTGGGAGGGSGGSTGGGGNGGGNGNGGAGGNGGGQGPDKPKK